MADGTGLMELVEAVRQVQADELLLSEAGVFWGRAPREDALPYGLLGQLAGVPMRRLGSDRIRRIRLSMKWCGAEASGRSGIEIASQLSSLNYDLWMHPMDGQMPQDRLNAKLEPLGWHALIPLEVSDIPAYADYVGELERWNIGHNFDFRIERMQ